MNPEVIAIGSCTLDCMLQVKDILRFELLDKDIIKKYTAYINWILINSFKYFFNLFKATSASPI